MDSHECSGMKLLRYNRTRSSSNPRTYKAYAVSNVKLACTHLNTNALDYKTHPFIKRVHVTVIDRSWSVHIIYIYVYKHDIYTVFVMIIFLYHYIYYIREGR